MKKNDNMAWAIAFCGIIHIIETIPDEKSPICQSFK